MIELPKGYKNPEVGEWMAIAIRDTARTNQQSSVKSVAVPARIGSASGPCERAVARDSVQSHCETWAVENVVAHGVTTGRH